ncbi:MAG: hypothetical protein ACT4PL_01960 [Phycisphaerales bacterium]
MNSTALRSPWFLALALGGAFASLAGAACFAKRDPVDCCKTYTISCTGGGYAWECTQTSSTSGCTVAAVGVANSGEAGKDTLQAPALGCSCTYTFRTCGSVPNQCIVQPGNPKVECNNERLVTDPNGVHNCTGTGS